MRCRGSRAAHWIGGAFRRAAGLEKAVSSLKNGRTNPFEKGDLSLLMRRSKVRWLRPCHPENEPKILAVAGLSRLRTLGPAAGRVFPGSRLTMGEAAAENQAGP